MWFFDYTIFSLFFFVICVIIVYSCSEYFKIVFLLSKLMDWVYFLSKKGLDHLSRNVGIDGPTKLQLPKRKKTKLKVVQDSSSESDGPFPANRSGSDSDLTEWNDNDKKRQKGKDWIQCIKCKRWMHENCTKFVTMCDLCGKCNKK